MPHFDIIPQLGAVRPLIRRFEAANTGSTFRVYFDSRTEIHRVRSEVVTVLGGAAGDTITLDCQNAAGTSMGTIVINGGSAVAVRGTDLVPTANNIIEAGSYMEVVVTKIGAATGAVDLHISGVDYPGG